ncbi:MAG: leucine-rich repeat protein [Clostridia bacterium]|nr:leucine-rich repeat protein [Clostridia bacterium]
MKTRKIISLLMVLMLCLSAVMPCMNTSAEGENLNAGELTLIDGSSYTIDYGYVIGVTTKTTVADVIAQFKNHTIQVAKSDGTTVMQSTEKIGTGCYVQLLKNGAVASSVKVVISGDVTGDGKINSRDIAIIQRLCVEEFSVEGAFQLAADADSNGRLNSRDIAAVQRAIINGSRDTGLPTTIPTAKPTNPEIVVSMSADNDTPSIGEIITVTIKFEKCPANINTLELVIPIDTEAFEAITTYENGIQVSPTYNLQKNINTTGGSCFRANGSEAFINFVDITETLTATAATVMTFQLKVKAAGTIAISESDSFFVDESTSKDITWTSNAVTVEPTTQTTNTSAPNPIQTPIRTVKPTETPVATTATPTTTPTIKPGQDSVTSNGTINGLKYDIIDNSYAEIKGYIGSETEIVIPSKINGYPVKRIGEEAFYFGKTFKSIEIPDSVTSIGAYAFWVCESLTDIKIPDGVELIEKFAFGYCSSLQSIKIPDSVKKIEIAAFQDCYSLTSVTIGSGLTSIVGSMFYDCNSLTSIVIPDTVTSIGQYAFYNCSSLTEIEIPDSVTTIYERAFSTCSSLTSITLGNGVTSITDYMFYDCSSLASVVIPDKVTGIYSDAFGKCSSLTEIEIPDSVTTIYGGAFSSCSSLTSIKVSENNANYCDVDGVLFNKDKTVLIQYPAGKSDTYTITNGVTSIGDYAFYGCESLINVELSDSVTTIGRMAFNDCTALTSIEIPDSVTRIDYGAFCGCDSLMSVIIGNGVSNIEDDVFSWCDALTNIKVSENNANYCDVDGVLFNKDKTIIIRYPEAKGGSSYTIPDSVARIANGAFKASHLLTNIVIPNSAMEIEGTAFYKCESLTSVEIPSSVTYIHGDAFGECDSLTIYGKSGSYAETYANKNGIPFVMGTAPIVTPTPTVAPTPTPAPSMEEITVDPESEYVIDSENGTLSAVDEKTSMEALVSKLENGESIVVTKANGEVVNDSEALVGTGYIVKLLDENGNVKDSVVVVVSGDTTGDAVANSRDIAAMQKHVIETKKLEGAFLLASDMKADGTLNSRDIAQLQKKLVG